MSSTVEQAQADVDIVLKKHGIGTYVVILKCPDSDNEATSFNGAYAWIAGHCSLMVDLMRHRYNADRYEGRHEG